VQELRVRHQVAENRTFRNIPDNEKEMAQKLENPGFWCNALACYWGMKGYCAHFVLGRWKDSFSWTYVSMWTLTTYDSFCYCLNRKIYIFLCHVGGFWWRPNLAPKLTRFQHSCLFMNWNDKICETKIANGRGKIQCIFQRIFSHFFFADFGQAVTHPPGYKGRALMDPLPWIFAVLHYFRKILPLVESL